jgi:hypothetical protein
MINMQFWLRTISVLNAVKPDKCKDPELPPLPIPDPSNVFVCKTHPKPSQWS